MSVSTRPGGHHVDRDAARGDFLGEGTREAHQARLGRRVVGLAGHAHEGYIDPMKMIEPREREPSRPSRRAR